MLTRDGTSVFTLNVPASGARVELVKVGPETMFNAQAENGSDKTAAIAESKTAMRPTKRFLMYYLERKTPPVLAGSPDFGYSPSSSRVMSRDERLLRSFPSQFD